MGDGSSEFGDKTKEISWLAQIEKHTLNQQRQSSLIQCSSLPPISELRTPISHLSPNSTLPYILESIVDFRSRGVEYPVRREMP